MAPRVLLRLVSRFAVIAAGLTACSSSGGGSGSGGSSGSGNPSCTSAPNCSGCQACFDACLCNGTDADACLVQCASLTGGAGGVGGSSGSGGAGAAGGVGGGTGGSGFGGAGGGTGGSGTGGSGGFSCTEVSTNNPSCDSCIHGACCSEIEACFTNPACAGLNQCLGTYCANASDISSCASQFCSQYGAGVNAFNAMGQCFGASCSGAC